MIPEVALHKIYLETPTMLKYKRMLTILAASILPLYFSMFRYHVFGATLRIADLVCAVTLFLTLLIFPKFYLKFFQVKFLPMWLLVGYIIVQGMLLENTASSVKESIQFLWVCFYLGIASIYTQWDSKAFFKWMLIFLALSALYTIFYHFSLGHFTRYKLASDGKYAFGLLTVLLLLKANSSSERRYWIYFAMSLIPLSLSMERKGVLGVILVIILVASIRVVIAKPKLKGAVIFLTGFTMLFIPYLLTQASDFIDGKIYESYFLDEKLALFTSNMHRESLLINAYQIIRDNFFFGIGADRITEFMGQFYADQRLNNGAHNFYMDMSVKYGVIGLFLHLLWAAVLSFFSYSSKRFSINLLLFNLYCLFVITFMADGQAVLIVFLFSFLNPYLFEHHD
ncbi:O-antigen ligase family protein [Psychromonas sp. 14N.309.X.WAT.B.A12]|uniref:O-antigen ligase family protein n=1 Tax=unclassified Psychromonas TaxID=2614957 RepID=UPI0025B1AB52|nr:O-antigen ligase family protein [Psychromonas sp. 14N.309.X.WAT.B.A12]MDN2664223.1 O-antigen ligase family protein [Psychromonas sp. 14N.309.X.WAT.B.A12]